MIIRMAPFNGKSGAPVEKKCLPEFPAASRTRLKTLAKLWIVEKLKIARRAPLAERVLAGESLDWSRLRQACG
jgi:hypothetical protein